jgi:hypothetical protein
MLVFDIRDLQNIQTYTPFNHASSIIHNIYVKDHFAHISYYTDGYVVLDVTNPVAPVEHGAYDTYAGPDNIFDGAWGVYPFAPSGRVYVSDISTGLYVLELTETDPCSDCPQPPCSDCEHYTGSLDGPGDAAWQPDGTYYFSPAGTHEGWLRGPADADFDLELYRWDSQRWTRVADATSSTSSEVVRYPGEDGYYAWRIVSRSGRGAYQFWLHRPESFGISPDDSTCTCNPH